MALFSLFKLPGYRNFDYNPRHYDEKKASRNARFGDIQKGLEVENDDYRPDMKARISRKNLYDNKRATTYSQFRIIMLAFLLLLVTFVLLADQLMSLLGL